MFRRCLNDTFEIFVLGVRCGFDWALIGHICVVYMSKRLKFYFAMVLLYTGRVKKKKSALGTNRSEHGHVDAPTGTAQHRPVPHQFEMQH